VIWEVTLRDAAGWARAALRQRYEWMEWIARALGGKKTQKQKKAAEKRCRNPVVCKICRKNCSDRMTVH